MGEMKKKKGAREARASLARVFFFISPIYFLAPATQATIIIASDKRSLQS